MRTRVAFVVVALLFVTRAFGQTCPESKSCSSSSAAVLGVNNSAAAGTGITSWGNYSGLTSGGYEYGMRATSYDPNGVAVYANDSSTDQYSQGMGVYAVSHTWIGIYGTSLSNAPSNGTSGVMGFATYVNGVRGASTYYNGVYGSSSTSAASGVYGYNGSNGYGVAGRTNTGSGYAVLGDNPSTAGYAGYFTGRGHFTGNLDKAGGGFLIDHPLDPSGKFLWHSFVESPDRKNIYDGVASLDISGRAVITLPEWFSTLNRDFRYQLTCIGGFAPVFVERELDASTNTFVIAGGKAGLRVSWQITGIRQDAWAKANPKEVEQVKTGAESGRYLHPDAFGKPTTLSIDALRAAGSTEPVSR